MAALTPITKVGVEELVIDQMEEVQNHHPNLEFVRDPDGSLWIRGGVGFSIVHKSRIVKDCYQIGLSIPDNFPASPPYVYETGGKIPKKFGHFMQAGNLCLEAPVEVRRRFAEHRNLSQFIDDQVVPYLFAYSHKCAYGCLPFADREHGILGLLQYYSEFFGTSRVAAVGLLKCLADGWAPPLMRCPCGSGHKLRDCHSRKLSELRPHLSRDSFEAELRNILDECRQAGVRLQKGSVMTKRMMKQERRRSKSTRSQRSRRRKGR